MAPIVVVVLLACPGAAQAHSLLRAGGGTLSYRALDATSLNTLTVQVTGGDLRFRDPTVDGGLDVGTCRPGDVDQQGYVIEGYCPLAGANGLYVDVGDREDTVSVTAPLPVTLRGGTGADVLSSGDLADDVEGGDGNDALDGGGGRDRLYGGDGADDLRGGAGDDAVFGEAGADRLDGGDGDDYIDARDGSADTVACGAGADRVEADELDQVALDCEIVTRPGGGPPPGPPPAGTPATDRTPPRLSVRAARVQRIARTRRLRLMATASEPGAVAASGYLDVGGLRLPLRSSRRKVSAAGGRVTITMPLDRRAMRHCLRAFRRHRKALVRLGVVATDVAGNSAQKRAPTITLRR
jgi:hypothetical protein